MAGVAVLCSGGGTNLQALINAGIKIDIVIASKAGIYAINRAEAANIPVRIARNGEKIAEILNSYNIGIAVLAGWLVILDKGFFQNYRGKTINIHPALLPKYGGKGFYGLRVHQAVLAAGEKVTGATVHYVTEEIDAGPIISQKTVDIHAGDTPEILMKRVLEEAEWPLLVEVVRCLTDQ